MPTARSRTAKPLAGANKVLRGEFKARKSRLGAAGRSAGSPAVGESWHPEFADLLPDAAYVLLLDGARIVAVNKAGVKQFCASRADQIIGRSNFDFIGQEYYEETRAHMREASKGAARAIYLKRRRLRLDGSDYPAEVSASPMRWNGKPAMLVVVRDLSEIARAEQKLRSLRDQLAEAVDSVSDGIALFDRNERFVFANARFLENDPARRDFLARGVTFETFITKTLERNPLMADRTDLRAEVERRLAWFRGEGTANEYQDARGRWFMVTHCRTPSGNTVIVSTDITVRKKIEQEVRDRAEQRYVRFDGIEIWTDATPEPIQWEGEPGALVFLRDATLRRRFRAAYDRQQAVLREAIENINKGIWVLDDDSRFLEAVEDLAVEELVAQLCSEIPASRQAIWVDLP